MSYCAVYLNRVYREKNCPEKPEDPLITEKDIPHDADFTFVDFVPSVLVYSTSGVEYHRFSHLVDTGNVWLKRNSQWQLVNCETVKLSYRHNLTNMVSRWEQQISPVTNYWATQTRGNEFETTLKVLRLWLRRRDEEEEKISNNEAATLKFIDFIPKRTGNVFESVDDLLVSVNGRIQQPDAKRWKLITLESLKVESNTDWTIDTEASLAEESQRHLTILRLFFQVLDDSDEEWGKFTIGVEDFRPHHLSGGSFFKRPHFESFSSLVNRATKWLAGQQSVYFLNAQSIDIKVKSFSKIDTRTCTHIENGDYIQTLRIIYYRCSNEEEDEQRPRSSQSMYLMQQQQPSNSLRMYSKVILTTKFEHPLDSIQQRIQAWLRTDSAVDVCVLSAETVDIYAKDNDEKQLEKASEECFQCNRLGSLNAYTFSAIRIFYCIWPETEASDRTRSLSSIPSHTSPVGCRRTAKKRLVNSASVTGSTTATGSSSTARHSRLRKQSTLDNSSNAVAIIGRSPNLDLWKNFEDFQNRSSCCCM